MKKIFILLIFVITGYYSVNAQCNLTADFDRSSRTICIGEPVVYYDLSNNGGDPGSYSWNWDFGPNANPATFNGQTPPTVTYSAAGTKTITLTYTTTGGGCTDVRQRDVEVIAQPTVSFTSNSPQCTGQQFNFSYTGSAALTYTWDFGIDANPGSSSIQNPQGITYSSSGTKTITLTIDNGICTQTASQTVTVSATPTVDFTSTAPKCTGETVDFANTGASVGVTYLWNFGTGASPGTSTLQNPTGIIYSVAGIKTVTFTITNSTTLCAVTATHTVNIKQTPTISFTSNTPVCAGANVNFTNSSSTGIGITYNWDFGSGAVPANSTAQHPSGIKYSTAGNKTVTLTVVNEFGCSASASAGITIKTVPVAAFSSSAPKCAGETVDFNNTGTATGVSYLWYLGSGSSPDTSVTENPQGIVYATPGIKDITLTLTDTSSGCAVTITQPINIFPKPVALFTSNAPVCAGDSVNFTNGSTTGTDILYNWDFGTDAMPAVSSSLNPDAVYYGSSGNKTVTLIVSNESGCNSTITQTISILQDPVAAFTYLSPNASNCSGDSVDFLNTGTAGASYSWNFGGNAIPSTAAVENPQNVIYASQGIKTIMLVTILGTCVDTAIQTINIIQTPAPSFTHNAPQCEGSAINFNYTGTADTNWVYLWDFGAGSTPSTSSQKNPQNIMYAGYGSKTALLTVSNGMCAEVAAATFMVNQIPVADFSYISPNSSNCTGDSVDFLNTGTTGATYSWDFGNGATPTASTAENPQNTVYTNSGIKTVMLIATLGSCTDTIRQTVNIIQTPAPSFTHNAPQCEGSAINFTYTGTTDTNWVYLWDFGNGAFPSSSSQINPQQIIYPGGNKLVLLTVSNGLCSEKVNAAFIINSLPVADAGKDTTICADRSVQIGSNGVNGYTYSWFPSGTLSSAIVANPVSSPVAAITHYSVTVRDTATGCVNSDSVVVTMLLPIQANAGIDVEICRNEKIQIGASLVEGQLYSWSPGSGLSSSILPDPVASPDSTTTYFLYVTASGCDMVTDQVTVTVHQLPLVNAGPDDTITNGSETQLVATGGVQYEWSPSSTLSNGGIYNPVASPLETTTYTVTSTDIHGCKNTDAVIISVLEPAFWLPNAFTPDGDGFNDVYYVRGRGFTDFEFFIFNRWGEQIFYSKSIEQGWDGKRQTTREDLPAGAYVYYLKGNKTNAEPVEVKGLVNLIR